MSRNGSAATLALAEALGYVVKEAVDRAVEKHASIVINEVGRIRSDVRKLDDRMDDLETRMESVGRAVGVAAS